MFKIFAIPTSTHKCTVVLSLPPANTGTMVLTYLPTYAYSGFDPLTLPHTYSGDAPPTHAYSGFDPPTHIQW